MRPTAMSFEIPESFRPEMSDEWIDQIEQTNRIISEIEKRKVDFIPLPNPPDATKKEHMKRGYSTLMQAHLRRFLCLIDCMELTWNTGRLLPCTIMGRSCMESAAIVVLINSKLEKQITAKDYNKAYYWIASHMLLVKTDIEASGFEDVKLKSIHIMDAIRSVEELIKGYLDTYAWLSEFLHPNSFGVFSSFCDYRPDLERATFRDSQEIDQKTISNCLAGLVSVPVFAKAFSQVGEIGRQVVDTDWRGDGELMKMFWPADRI
jgi:hypothetical protein